MAFQRLPHDEGYPLNTYRPIKRRPLPTEHLSASLNSPFSPPIPIKHAKTPSINSFSDFGSTSDYNNQNASTQAFLQKDVEHGKVPQNRARFLDSRSNDNLSDHFRPGKKWQPGVLNQLPWLGIAAILCTILFTCAAMVVLIVSNGKPINEWNSTLQPTVYISISSALANITLTYALYNGMVISFWRKIGRGATLQEVHQYWHSGASLWGAIQGVTFWRGKVTAIACIMTIIAILRGPLLQRASSVKNVVTFANGTMEIHVAQQLPWGYTGTDSGRTSSPSYMNPNFTAVLQDYSNRKPIEVVHSGCQDSATCQTSIKAFGFGVQCNITHYPYSIEVLVDKNGTVSNFPTVQAFNTIADAIAVYHHGPSQELDADGFKSHSEIGGQNTGLMLNSTFMPNATEAQNYSLTSHACTLRGGIVSYPVLLSNNTVSLRSSSWRDDTFLQDRGLMELQYNEPSNIAGFILAANNLYQSNATYEFGGGVGWILNFQGFMANQYMKRYVGSANYYYINGNISFDDPMEDMINGMRELAFRTSIQVATDNLTFTDSLQRVSYTGTKPETIYTTNFQYMAAGVIVSLLGVIAVVPTFRGWWELGRPVSLSPLEIAKAFDAPLLRDMQGNITASEMLKESGRIFIRYGDESGDVLRDGTSYNGNVDDSVRKLTVGELTTVKPPEKGVRYV